MRKIRMENHTIDTIFVLVLFCVFAIAVLLVLLAGTGAYQDIADRMERQYEERTCLSYLDAKVRHYDETGMAAVETIGDFEALALYEDIDGIRYKTLIYCADGYVRELFFEDGLQFSPEDGQPVVPAKSLQVIQKGDTLIQLICTGVEGKQEELLLYLRSEKGADFYA